MTLLRSGCSFDTSPPAGHCGETAAAYPVNRVPDRHLWASTLAAVSIERRSVSARQPPADVRLRAAIAVQSAEQKDEPDPCPIT